MNFKFDLQIFAGAMVVVNEEGRQYSTNGGATWVKTSPLNAPSGITNYYDGRTYWVANGNGIVAGFSGDVRVMDAAAFGNTPTALADLPDPTPATGAIAVGTTATVQAANKEGVFTFENGVITGLTNTGLVTTNNAAPVEFKNVSGNVKAATAGSYTLSSFSGEIQAGAVSDITGGTLTTTSDFSADVMGCAFTKANIFGYATNSNNDPIYTVQAISTSQTYAQLGNGNTNWSVVGSANADAFTTAGAGFVTLDGGAGADTFTLANTGGTYVVGGEGGDKMNIGADVGAGSSIFGGDGDDSVYGSANATLKSGAYIDLGNGNDTLNADNTKDVAFASGAVIFGGEGKDVINLVNFNNAGNGNANVTYEISVDGGVGDDSITGNARITNSTVVGGDGNDTIGGFDKSVTLTGGSGSDYFKLGATGNFSNVGDYVFGEDYIALTTNTKAVAGANGWVTGKYLASDGDAGYINDDTANGAATITSSAGFFAATVVDGDATKVNVAWVNGSPVTIDGSSQNIASVITGKTNSEADLLIGGSKADTIYAAAGDSVYGGAGSDNIVLTDKEYGEYVGLSTAGGADSVTGFNAGWDIEKADALYMMDGTADGLKLGITGTDVTLKSGSATMSIKGAADATGANLLISDKKVDLIAKGKTIAVTDDSTIADYYIGTENAGISLKNYTSDLEVNLSNEMFRNITTLEGGAGSTSILGGKAAESLKGGTGDSSLYGGAGVDTLVSGDGKTTFFATSESGKDVVTGFVVGSDDTSDVLNVSSISKVSRTSGTNFTVNVDNSNSLKVTQKSGNVNSNIQWVSGEASGVAKIGTTDSNNTFSYDTDTTNYIGGNKVDTVSLTSGTTDNFNVWLDQTGGMFNSIEVYDLKNTSGDVLMAGKADTKETIIGGKSNASLWGGAGNTTDVLKSTSGSTTDFFYGLGDGNDSISGSANDTVNLYNINLSDITKADINSGSVVFTTTANNTVTVSGSVGTFKLADGTAWTANYSSKTWSEAE